MNLFVAIQKFLFVPSRRFVGAGGLEGENGNPESADCEGFPSPEPDDKLDETQTKERLLSKRVFR